MGFCDAGSRKKNKAASDDKSHIMISYNWGSKPTMLKVRDRLRAAGFNVWMDVDNMSKFPPSFIIGYKCILNNLRVSIYRINEINSFLSLHVQRYF